MTREILPQPLHLVLGFLIFAAGCVGAALAIPGCHAGGRSDLDEPVGVTMTGIVSPPRVSSAATITDGGGRADADLQRNGPCAMAASSSSFLFDVGSSTITPSQDAELRQIAQCLTISSKSRGGGGVIILAIGHADPVGGRAENLTLALERSSKIRSFLIAHGMPADRVIATATGERATAATIPGRRVDVVVVPSESAPSSIERRNE